MKKTFAFILLILIITGIAISFYLKEDEIYAIASLLYAPFLANFYVAVRYNMSHKLDKFVFAILGFSFLSDLLNQFYENDSLTVYFQILAVFIYQSLYLAYFRLEGAFVNISSFADFLKVFIPSAILFLLFGHYFLDHPDNLTYFLLFLTNLQLTLLVVLVLFRSVKPEIYWTGFLGIAFITICDIAYCFYFFTFDLPQLLPTIIFSYLIGQFLLIYSISLNLNNQKSQKAN